MDGAERSGNNKLQSNDTNLNLIQLSTRSEPSSRRARISEPQAVAQNDPIYCPDTPSFVGPFTPPECRAVTAEPADMREPSWLDTHERETALSTYGAGMLIGLIRYLSFDEKTKGVFKPLKASIAGSKASLYSGADLLLDSHLMSNHFGHLDPKLFEPSIPETFAISAASTIPNLRLRTTVVGSAWLLGRVYDYAWGKFSSK